MNGKNSTGGQLAGIPEELGLQVVGLLQALEKESKQSEEALQESEGRYLRCIELSPIGIGISSLDGQVLHTNKAMQSITGYSREEFKKINLADTCWSQGDRKPLLEVLKQGGSVSGYPMKLKRKDGIPYVAILYLSRIQLDGTEVLQMICVGITEGELIDGTLQEYEEKYRKLFELFPIGVAILDMKGVIISYNAAVDEEVGYSESDLVGKHFTEIAPVRLRDIPKHIKTFNSVIKGKVPAPFEVAYTCKNGTTSWVEVHVSLLKAGGRKLGIQVLQKDITKRKRAEGSQERASVVAADRPLAPLQERFARSGLEYFNGQEAIELLMSVCQFEKQDEVIKKCLNKFRNIRELMASSPQELKQVGLPPLCLTYIKLLREIPAEVLREKIIERPVYESSQQIFDYLYYSMRDLKKEIFKVIYLNKRDQIINITDLFKGEAGSLYASPHKIIETAMEHNTTALIFVHNHPSGDPVPSKIDKRFTRDLVFVGNILQMKVVDHIIIGNDRYYSFADEGLIEEYEMDFLNLRLRGTSESKRRIYQARLVRDKRA
ncbi:MAG: DNA repair protein RadC [Dehalococcoidales bacterium]